METERKIGIHPITSGTNTSQQETVPFGAATITLETNGAATDAIRDMLAREYGVEPDGIDYQAYRDLAARVSPTAFRRNGLLATLNAQYSGDIRQAVRAVLPGIQGRPLLSLDEYRPNDDLQEEWREREEVLEGKITRIGSFLRKEPIPSDYGKRAVENQRKRGKRKKRISLSAEKYQQRKDKDTVDREERMDERRALWSFVHPGEQVLKLYGGYETQTLTTLMGRVGKDGMVYYVTAAPHLREQLHENMFNVFANLQVLKDDTWKDHPEKRGLPKGMAEFFGGFFSAPYLYSTPFYESGYSTDARQRYVDAFYRRAQLTPVHHFAPPLPSEIRSGSMDAVIETDRLARVPEDKKEELLYEIDRVLKPGGRLLIREGSREQTAIAYYGQGLLGKDYKKIWLKGYKHPARWMVYQKEGAPVSIVVPGIRPTFQTQEVPIMQQAPTEEVEEVKPADRKGALGHEVYAALQDSETGTVSISWFRSKGLLPPLMTDFGGDINKAIEYARKQNKPMFEQPTMPTIRVPEGAKPVYTIEDLSQELGIPKAVVKREVNRLGIKALGAATGYSGQSGFSKKAVEGRQLKFSYQEYAILKEALHRQKANQRSKNKKEEA